MRTLASYYINPELTSPERLWFKGELVRPFWSTQFEPNGILAVEYMTGPDAGKLTQAKPAELSESPLARGTVS